MTLKSKQIDHAPVGMHGDGQGLYLRVQGGGAKSWIFRYQLGGIRREMGLGSLTERPAHEARLEAAKLRASIRSGTDPIASRRRAAQEAELERQRVAVAATDFMSITAEYIQSHRAGWTNAKHAAQWESTLKTYVFPFVGNKDVAAIGTEDVLRILEPIWAKKTETASRVRSRIELVLSYAKARNLRRGENPAVWRGHLDALLPKPTKVAPVRHHPALPFARASAFMTALRHADGNGARALEFATLTAARSGEVRLMKWSEIDLVSNVWTVPAKRMKANREHRVPLSNAAVDLVNALLRIEGNPYVFPGVRESTPISDMTLTATIRRMNDTGIEPQWIDPRTGAQVVPHGFRSTFRDWAAEATEFPAEMAEMALAHTVGDKVEAAYRRGDMFERRRAMMSAWASFLTATP